MITKENVHKFSRHYLACKDRKTKAIALTFIKSGLIDYDKEKKVYSITLSSAQYQIKWEKGKFSCNCGFEDCPHVLALYLQLKIWNSKPTEKDISAELLD